MRQRSTEQIFVDLYMYFAGKGLLPLPAAAPRQRKRKRVFREGDLLKPPQAARFLKVNVKTLANWRVTGKGPSFHKIGSRVVYDFAELKAFAVSGSRTSTSDKGDQ
ncbi:helix-turn-helix domain-containing protein [Mesorhizobium caraganae]|uniref:helix-turn-helix domain-containing protein n=1 Tax=Mesorhizobium caraganae TaxID=483206 RepID=UPI003ED047D2